MTSLKAYGLSIAIAAGTALPGWCAPTAEPATERSWLGRLWSKPDPKTPAKPAATQPLSAEALAEAVEAERLAWQRRMDVCTELRRVAIEKNDDVLLRHVDDLETQTINLYNQRTAALGVKKFTTAGHATLDQTANRPTTRNALNREASR